MNTWAEFFASIKEKDYAKRLNAFLNEEYAKYVCYPPRELMFNAFNHTKLSDVKVVIFGQDPYHEPGQAMGLSFSVPQTVKVPPSLVNIYKEIEDEYDTSIDKSNGDLTCWAEQGVLLLNSILSVRAHIPMSHNIKEYELFFEDILEVLDKQKKPIVFMLWGGSARKYKKYLHNPTHFVLNHPPLFAAKGEGWALSKTK